METDLRASLIASGVAALLSVLVGLVSGVGALALFVRALLGGLGFGAFVFGALSLLRRFVPELFESQAEAFPTTGTSVDIVLPGDLPEGGETLEVGAEASESVPAAPSRPAPRARRSRQGADLVEEAEEIDFGSESLLEDSVPVDGPPGPPPLPAAGGGGSFDELDVLPDLEALSGGFSPLAGEAQGEAPLDLDESPPSRPQGGRGSDADPMVLAQAVRTLLKRDQER